ncbi:MAG: hypothetical protein U0572_10575 [Phycisphaerales bacterium]
MNKQDSGRLSRWSSLRRFVLPMAVCGALWAAGGASMPPPCTMGWSEVGGGTDGRVRALAVFNDGLGNGPALYAAGLFETAGDVAVNNIACWNGESWQPVGNGVGTATTSVMCMSPVRIAGIPMLFLGGWFSAADELPVNYVTAWNGEACCPLWTGMNDGVLALTAFDDGSGTALYAGGLFTTAGDVAASHIARWDGEAWSPVGQGFDGGVFALATYDDGSGVALYAGGDFTYSGDTKVKHIARWNGEAWEPVGTGTNDAIHAFAVFDDGRGLSLIAGGLFTKAGGMPIPYVARWNGATWSPLDTRGNAPNASVHALATFDDGHGSALYVGGQFTSIGGSPAPYVAKWNGRTWARLGAGLNDRVQSMVVFTDPFSGPSLYVGGVFTSAGELTVNHIARWGCMTPE